LRSHLTVPLAILNYPSQAQKYQKNENNTPDVSFSTTNHYAVGHPGCFKGKKIPKT
jgi:hypothetical protein